MKRSGYVFEELFLWHDPGSISFDKYTQPGEHWENPDTKRRLHSLLCVSGLVNDMVRIPARHATREELLTFHTPEYVDSIMQMSKNKIVSESGEGARFSQHGFEIATLACGGVLSAVEAVIEGTVTNCYALVRPPGHHAEPDRGRGFCIFNNVVIGCFKAKELGLKKVAIIDFDVHHGNGTQVAFENDPSVLYISVHQHYNYPFDSGEIIPNNPTSINIPLPPGSGMGAYGACFDHVVMPALDRFKPELILVSSGFDASCFDRLGQQMLSSEDYRKMTTSLLEIADKYSQGRVVFCHEGGYSKEYVPFCGLAVCEELVGKRTEVIDDYMEEITLKGFQDLQVLQLAVIAQAAKQAGLYDTDFSKEEEAKREIQKILDTLDTSLSKANVLTGLNI